MSWAAALPLWVTIALAVAAAGYIRKRGGGTALESLERANRVLEKRVVELERANTQLLGEVAALTATRDVSVAIAPVLAALVEHEERAAGRGDRHAILLQMIADRLGADVNGEAA